MNGIVYGEKCSLPGENGMRQTQSVVVPGDQSPKDEQRTGQERYCGCCCWWGIARCHYADMNAGRHFELLNTPVESTLVSAGVSSRRIGGSF